MDDPYLELVELRSQGELGVWEPIGRAVRTGPWGEQARSSVDAIEQALVEGRRAEAAALARHLVVEAAEIHDLFTSWTAAAPRILAREGVPPDALEKERTRLVERTGAEDPAGDWERFQAAAETLAHACEEGRPGVEEVEQTVSAWADAHDRHCDLVAGWIDVAVRRLGEERLGHLWAELEADGIDAYRRYDVRENPWPRSFALLVQIALEGMHGHLGGPTRRGEVELAEHEDRVEMRFRPCGSGGRIRGAERFGVTMGRYDWAWNETGVCHYCVHCCVLMQLEPIKRFGYPARVIEPPLRPGDPCTWTVYRDPALVPAEAYRRVGQDKPGGG